MVGLDEHRLGESGAVAPPAADTHRILLQGAQPRQRLAGIEDVRPEAAASAIDRAESALHSSRPDHVLGPATVAATIARRPFLSELSGEWVETQRRRLERQLLRSLDCLSEMRLHSGEPGLAVETATEAVTLDPFGERSHQLLMQAYVADGSRAKALVVYRGLQELLADELDAEPSPETEALYRKIFH